MKKIKVIVLSLSLVLGFTGTYAFAEYLPLTSPVRQQQMAWWGGLYPEYCLPGAMEQTGGGQEMEEGEDIPVKIRFKYLTFLNETGE